jgi:SPP1 gp7 family putative phage head morphogenesis protein
MAEPEAFKVISPEAVDYIKSKLRLGTRAWTDIWQGMHARAFVVAGAMADELVADFHEAVTEAIAEGRSLKWFREQFDKIVAKHGWSYKGSRGWRSKVIYQTNLRMAHAAGRWAQIQEVKRVRPWLVYVAVMDQRTRPQHRHWHDTVLAVDDPWWQTHFPPNGWNCRCKAQAMSDRDLKRYGVKPSAEPPPSPLVMKMIRTPQGAVPVEVPEGIDPGFAYNPGVAGFGGGPDITAIYPREGDWPKLLPPWELPLEPLPVDTPKAQIYKRVSPDESSLREALRNAIGGDSAIFTDPLGGRIELGQAIVTHLIEVPKRINGRERYMPLFQELIEEPAEIWMGFASDPAGGKVTVRRRYIKLIRIEHEGGKAKQDSLGLVADATGHYWSGLTFFPGNKNASSLRTGYRAYRRPK